MLKLPVRIVAVVALAGLVFGVFVVSKIGSSTAQSVEPTPGVSSGSPGTGETVSSGEIPINSGFEWTLERMLLATPMPMTGEERNFLSSHPPLEKLREWDQAQFDSYVSSELGRRQAAQEGVRWRELVGMLEKQQVAGARFFKQKLPAKAEPDKDLLTTADFEKFQTLIQKDPAAVFAKMKDWRESIARLAASVESMRKKAEKRGLSEQFNDATSAAE